MRWLIKLTAALLVSLLLLEIMVRCLVLSPAREQYVEKIGYGHAPLSEVLRTYEGYARLRVDDLGLNNPPLPDPLPEHRLLVMGDSFVEALQVMQEENFESRLQQAWSDRGGALVYNAGFDGSDPSFDPDIVDWLMPYVQPQGLLVCVNAHDLTEISRWPVKRQDDGSMTGFVHDVQPPGMLKRTVLWVYAHSALVTHLKWKYEHEVRNWWHALSAGSVAVDPQPVKTVDDFHAGEEGWRWVLQQLSAKGMPVTVLLMPEIRYSATGAEAVDSERRQRLQAVAEALGIPVLDGNQPLLAEFAHSGQPGVGFANTHFGEGHINARGHAALASWLADKRQVLLR